jgi:hypothetical protein
MMKIPLGKVTEHDECTRRRTGNRRQIGEENSGTNAVEQIAEEYRYHPLIC